MYYIDFEDVRSRLWQAWGFVLGFWEHRDRHRRYNAFLYNMALHDVGHAKLGTPPQGRGMSFQLPTKEAPNPVVVFENPRRITRADLHSPDQEIAEILGMLQIRFTDLGR
jgi:hypothetical protein